jgi:hypothetical protein
MARQATRPQRHYPRFCSLLYRQRENIQRTGTNYRIFTRLSDLQFSGNLQLRYPVLIDDVPDKCELVLEQPGMYQSIAINNNPYIFKTNGFFVDHEFKHPTYPDYSIKG